MTWFSSFFLCRLRRFSTFLLFFFFCNTLEIVKVFIYELCLFQRHLELIENLSHSLETKIEKSDAKVLTEVKNLVKSLQDLEQNLYKEFQKLIFCHYEKRLSNFLKVSSTKLKKYSSVSPSKYDLQKNITKLEVRLLNVFCLFVVVTLKTEFGSTVVTTVFAYLVVLISSFKNH